MGAPPHRAARAAAARAGVQRLPAGQRRGGSAAPSIRSIWLGLCAALTRLGVGVRVHGSVGMQHLTALPYTHADSDIDLTLPVQSAAMATTWWPCCWRPRWRCRGASTRLLLPDGGALAWREWQPWRQGRTDQLLVKRLHGVALETGLRWLHAEPRHERAAASGRRSPGGGARSTRAIHRARRHRRALRRTGTRPETWAGVVCRQRQPRRHGRAHVHAQPVALRHYFQHAALLAPRRRRSASSKRSASPPKPACCGPPAASTRTAARSSRWACCAPAWAARCGRPPTHRRRGAHALLTRWGDALRARSTRSTQSNGQRVARRHGLRSVGAEAALGFPVLFTHTLPALQAAHAHGLGPTLARLDALFHTIAVLDDTNLAHRGGLAGLHFAQAEARRFVAAGGAAHPDALARARAIGVRFVARRLSPGGAADVLAAACFLDRACALP